MERGKADHLRRGEKWGGMEYSSRTFAHAFSCLPPAPHLNLTWLRDSRWGGEMWASQQETFLLGLKFLWWFWTVLECDCLELCLSVFGRLFEGLCATFLLLSVFRIPHILTPQALSSCSNPPGQSPARAAPGTPLQLRKQRKRNQKGGGNLGGIAEVQKFLDELPVQATSGAELTAPEWPLGQERIEQVL